MTKYGVLILELQHMVGEGYREDKESLYRPKYTATNWMALILSDFGLKKDNPKIRKTAELIFKQWMNAENKENIFKGEVCILGNTARMMIRFGYGDDPRVLKLIDRLLEDQKKDGLWHCDTVPNGTLDGWEALSAFAAIPGEKRTRKIKKSIERGAEFYLERRLFREDRLKYAPWFRFHSPAHYYDILVGLDVLTKLGYGDDRRLAPALGVMKEKRRRDGTWVLDAIHPDPPGYEWGRGNLKSKVTPFALEDLGRPSKWITLKALRVLKRVDEA